HQHEALRRSERAQFECLSRRGCERLLDEDVLPREERCPGDSVVCGDRRCDDYRVDVVVAQEIVEVVGRDEPGVTQLRPLACRLTGVAERPQLGVLQLVEVPRQVWPPVAVADDAYPNAVDGHAVTPVRKTAIGVSRIRRKSSPNDHPRTYAT